MKYSPPYEDVVGYGWAIGSLFNRKMEHHNSEINGFVSNVAPFPDDHVLIVVLCNRDGIQMDSITKDLAAIVLGEAYQLPKERRIVLSWTRVFTSNTRVRTRSQPILS